MTYTIETKDTVYDAETPAQVLAIIRQIRSSYDANNAGKGFGLRVKVNGITHTIEKWLFDNNAEYYIKIIANK